MLRKLCRRDFYTYRHALPVLQADASKRTDEALAIDVQNGCQRKGGEGARPKKSPVFDGYRRIGGVGAL